MKCWGRNFSGQLGNGGPLTVSATPVDVVGLAGGVAAVAGGDDHTCAITTSYEVKCWGGNTSGELGNGGTTNSSTPVDVIGLKGATYSITTIANPSEGGSVSCNPATVPSGGSSTCTATPNPNYAFTNFSGDCAGATCTLTNVTANKTVTANFTAATPLIATTTTLSLAPNPAQVGQPITASVRVNESAGAGGIDTAAAALGESAAAAGGTVTVGSGAVNCTATLISGIGSCTLTFANPGTYTVSANYGGDATHSGSSASVSLVVNMAAPADVVSAPALDRWAMLLLVMVLGRMVWRRRLRG